MRTIRPWVRALVAWLAAAALLPLGALLLLTVHSYLLPFPPALERAPDVGQRILDRDGQLLARTVAQDGLFRAPLVLAETGPHLTRAMLAAEDKRFHSHIGLDPLAMARAGTQILASGQVVSGASTITQQLARTTFQRPRTVWGKWREMALALRIERGLSKAQILERYLQRVSFGPRIAGAAAAADHYFGKELSALSLGEAATLAGLVRGPTLYDPRARPELARQRRDEVLRRMVALGLASESEARRAQDTPVRLLPRPPLPGARHWVRQVGARSGEAVMRTTLVGGLQREVEAIARERAWQLQARSVTAASVVVLDNASGQILAWVGSPDFDAPRDGQNDGVVALRQPGSTLKPFLYALAIEDLGMTTASFLPDEPSQFRTASGFYEPRNFDRTYRGQVRLSRALANSLNVPAVHVISQLGIGVALERLRELGLSSLERDAAHYGPALALGDGEVTLLELTAAYAVLARGGTSLTPQYLVAIDKSSAKRVLSPGACALVSEMLSDAVARREVFGAENALELPFPVAVKTGTSKGYRDSWAVGYTSAITVGAWVGNFDGSPTERVTGARGAGPLFHRVMQAAARVLGPSATAARGRRPLHDVALSRVAVCGDRTEPQAARACAPGEREALFWLTPEQASRGPQARQADRGGNQAARANAIGVSYPKDGMIFGYDPAIPPERQRLVLRSRVSDEPVTLVVDDQALETRQGRAEWVLRPGRHEVVATGPGGVRSAAVEFFVRQ